MGFGQLRKVVRRQRGNRALWALLGVCVLALLFWIRPESPSFTVNSPPHQSSAEASANLANFRGVGHIFDVIGEYKLPKPVIISTDSAAEIWGNLGVNVRPLGDEKFMVAPQLPSQYRFFNEIDEASLMDMQGQPVKSATNPGIRVEHDVVTEAEEETIIAELREMAVQYGYDFSEEGATMEKSWRITGRDEKKSGLPLAPWGWGTEFNASKLPIGLAKVIERIEQLPGYPLGPIRDVTVNIRSSVDYQMTPHIDPPGEARYVWTHAVRPPATRMGEDGLEAYDRWGTWEKVLRRRQDRAAIIFTFADPHVGPAATDDGIEVSQTG